MSIVSASAFDIWRGWIGDVLASVRQQVESAAFRHAKIGGDACTATLIWIRTGSRGEASGILTTMEHSGDVHISPGVHQLITFLQTLPTDVRQEIIHSLNTASIGVPK